MKVAAAIVGISLVLGEATHDAVRYLADAIAPAPIVHQCASRNGVLVVPDDREIEAYAAECRLPRITETRAGMPAPIT